MTSSVRIRELFQLHCRVVLHSGLVFWSAFATRVFSVCAESHGLPSILHALCSLSALDYSFFSFGSSFDSCLLACLLVAFEVCCSQDAAKLKFQQSWTAAALRRPVQSLAKSYNCRTSSGAALTHQMPNQALACLWHVTYTHACF